MPLGSTSVDQAEILAKKFLEDYATDYDYDLLKEYVYDAMAEEGNFFQEVYAERVKEVGAAIRRAKIIVKFGR